MSQLIDPEEFNLPQRTVIEQISNDHIAIVISRKSRIIMSDGKKILEKVEKIKELKPRVKVSLKTSTPFCRKTRAFLEDKDIKVI